MIITTSLRENETLIARAQELAHELGADYQPRRKLSLAKSLERFGPFYLLYKDRLSFVNADASELTFHPDTAALRIKAPHDALVSLLGKSPKTILDTTMGLASDSLVMATAGNQVTALESQDVIFQVVSRGLASYQTDDKQLKKVMRSIKAIKSDSLSFLKAQADNSFDIIYADPMFSEIIKESENLEAIKPLANGSRLTEEWLKEAKRVARDKIIIKAHFRDTVFEELGFERQVRPNQKLHYGVMDVSEDH
ncbi:class I SAM-dependent methyltransferase [Streptococcus sp. ACS2]|uniref:class I SAM-dependent methyltransferase n=1 Tax=Streptococcus sp. ACS2 TaxID=936576 RepID=UPI000448E495|nr:class I SAM-dependent methyltransferase [Streptococcus sp. ACS2]EUC61932.1 SAM-dependent methyltransferase domain protein [Streptococcus sp. ACS2]